MLFEIANDPQRHQLILDLLLGLIINFPEKSSFFFKDWFTSITLFTQSALICTGSVTVF